MSYSVILIEPENAGNIGSIARLMANFGVKDLILVNPSADLKSNECRSFAVRAYSIIEKARIVRSFDDLVSEFDFLVGTTAKVKDDPVRAGVGLKQLAGKLKGLKAKVGLVFGRESSGLTNEELKKCDLVINIPTSKEYPALNLSHAVGIVLYELFSEKSEEVASAAGRKEKQALVNAFSQAVEGVELRRKEEVVKMFENIVNRAFVTKKEASALTGVFRKLSNRT